jgi:alcohol dehydrogenase
MLGAQLFGAGVLVAIDPKASRLHAAQQFGADIVATPQEAEAVLRTVDKDGKADVVIEAVGTPETFEMCTSLVRPGGHVANAGVHGKPAQLHLESLWIADVTITTGLVDTTSIPTLMKLVERGKLDSTLFTTHNFGLHQAPAAYDFFSDADRYEALKVVMHRD